MWKRTAAVAALMLAAGTSVGRAVPLYEYEFDGATGVPSTTAGGGTLTITSSANGASTFAGVGVSGLAGDNAYDGFNNVNQYNTANPAGIASTAAGDVATGLGTLTQFTVTLWMKPNNGFPMPNQNNSTVNARIMMAGNSASYDQGANGFHVSLNSSDKIQKGVNGANPISANNLGTFLPANSIPANDWVFVAFAYDGDVANNVFFDPVIRAATNNEASNNAYVYLGGRSQPPVLFDSGAVLAAGNVSPGPVNIGASGFVFVGNRANLLRDFTGLVDELQIHNSILTKAELETIRMSVPGNTVPEPGAAGLMGAAALAALARRRRR